MTKSLAAAAVVTTMTGIGVYRSVTAYRNILAIALTIDVIGATGLLAVLSWLGAFP